MKLFYGLIGAGGHGVEVMPMLCSMIRDELKSGSAEVLFVVEGQKYETVVNGYRLIGLDAFLAMKCCKKFNVAIGDSRVRQRIVEICFSSGIESFSLVASSAIILDNNNIGEGCMISEQTIITSNVRIGRFFQANCQCNISHDCVLGDYVTFAPGVKCNGNVMVCDHAYIGAGAMIRHGRHGNPLVIGEGAVVGMGAVVVKDVEPYTTVVGNPARRMYKK